MITLAQADIGSLKADFIKSMVVALFAFGVFFSFAVAAVVAVLQYRMEKNSKAREEKRVKESQPREIHPQPLPIDKVPKRFNPELARSQKEEVDRRLDGHDAEIDSIWNALHAEDEATRKELREYVAQTNLSLGRIEGKLGTLPMEKKA